MNLAMTESLTEPGRAMDAAIAQRDVGGLLRIVAQIESGIDPDEKPPAWLFADGLAMLWVCGGFDALLTAVQSPVVESWSAYRVLNSRARRLTGEQLGRMVALIGAPQPGRARTAHLRQTIVAHPAAEVTDGLLAFIAEHSAGASVDVANFNAGRPQRPWRGKGDALAVADAVAALGQRRGPDIPDALIGLLRELPWGEDAYTTAALLEGLLHHPDERCRQAVSAALAQRADPGAVRLMLLAGEHTFAPQPALGRLLGDLAGAMDAPMRMEYLALLKTWMLAKTGGPLDAAFVAALERLTPRDWPVSLRVKLAMLLREAAPQHIRLARLEFGDRVLTALIAGFEKFRMDSRGHAWRLPMLLAGTVALSALLNAALDRPSPFTRGVNGTLVFAWLLTLVITSRSRFTREERHGSKLWKALLFWLVTATMIASIIGTRIHARWG